eukprot:4170923-Pleurochrysis_carterae.AAC.1
MSCKQKGRQAANLHSRATRSLRFDGRELRLRVDAKEKRHVQVVGQCRREADDPCARMRRRRDRRRFSGDAS